LTVQSTTAQIQKKEEEESEKGKKGKGKNVFILLFIVGSIDVYSFV
jgi:hypothetical protein